MTLPIADTGMPEPEAMAEPEPAGVAPLRPTTLPEPGEVAEPEPGATTEPEPGGAALAGTGAGAVETGAAGEGAEEPTTDPLCTATAAAAEAGTCRVRRDFAPAACALVATSATINTVMM
jgi:hypothetical protein